MDTTIELITGQEILDSRGNPTVDVEGFVLMAFNVSLRQTLGPKDLKVSKLRYTYLRRKIP